MSMKPATKRIVLLTSSLLIFSGFVLLVYLPLHKAIGSEKKRLAQKQAEIGRQSQLFEELEAIRAETEQIESFTATWRTVVAPNLHLSLMLGNISRRAQQTGTTALRLEPGEVTQMEATKRVPIKLGCRGSFGEVHRLICELEAMPHQIWIHRIELAPTPNQQQELTCEIDLEAFVACNTNSD